MAIYNQQQLISASNATYFTNVYGGISASAVRDLNYSWISSSALLSGSQTFVGDQIISGNVNITGTFTSSLQTGYLYVGDGNGKTQAVATSSIVTNINTGSFATTGSNTFTGQQTIQSNNVTFGTTGSASTNGLTFPNSKIHQDNFLNLKGLGNVGVDISTDGTATSTGVNINLRNTNTNGDIQLTTSNGNIKLDAGTQNINLYGAVNLISGSNSKLTFPNSASITGNTGAPLTISASKGLTINSNDLTNYTSLKMNQGAFISSSVFGIATYAGQDPSGYFSLGAIALNIADLSNNQYAALAKYGFEVGWNNTFATNFWINNPDYFGLTNVTGTSGSGTIIAGSDPSDNYVGLVQFQNKGNWTDGRTTFLTPISASAGFTSSLQNGNIWVGNSNNQNTQITTASFIAQITSSIPAVNTGSFLTTASYSDTTKNLTFTKADASTFNINGLASTGSNTFVGIETLQDAGGNTTAITPYSGSLIFVGKTWTSSSFSHITSSATATNFPNFIFKSNNTTPTLTITGSNNIISHPVAPQTGMKYYIGSNNLLLNVIPQVSSSMTQVPLIINNNYGVAPVQLRGPASSSGTWTYSGNIGLAQAFIGNQASPADKLFSNVTIGTNALINSVTVAANKTPLSASLGFSSNQTAFGPNTLNLNSSSLNMFGNIAGNFTLNNNYYYTTDPTLNYLDVTSNILQGVNVTTSGSNSSLPGNTNPRFLHTNLIFTSNGIQNTFLQNASSSIALNQEGIASSLVGTLAVGLGFVITGSNAIQQNNVPTGIISGSGAGSAFLGRYNASDGIRDKSAENILVVGTGTSYSNRKTGFLIDSGSNTFVEGTFNVSGSSSMTGSVSVKGNQTINGVGTTTSPLQINKQIGNYAPDISVGDYNSGNGFALSQYDNGTSFNSAGMLMAGNSNAFIDMYANGGNYDSFHLEVNSNNSGVSFQDYNGSSYVEFMNVATLGGNISLKRNTQITGSLTTTGDVTAQSKMILSQVSSSLNFANDTAAAAGGVPLGGLYRNGNFVMIRLT